MSRKKTKRVLPPRHKRMKRPQRLQGAKRWLPKYTGKNIIRGYSKHFAVDWICAIKELAMLGVLLDPNHVAQLKRTVETQIRANRARKLKKKEEEAQDSLLYSESDENFAFIFE